MVSMGWIPRWASERDHQIKKSCPSREELGVTTIGAEASGEAGWLRHIVPAVQMMVKLQLQLQEVEQLYKLINFTQLIVREFVSLMQVWLVSELHLLQLNFK